KWGAVTAEAFRLAAERERLTTELASRDQQISAELTKHRGLLQSMQWTAAGADPSAVLARLAELAQAKRMRIMAIGPIERQATPQFAKSWHVVQIQAPFREMRDLAARIEQDKGLLEDLRLEAAPSAPSSVPTVPAPPDEIQARFKIAALELTAPAKQIIARVASGSAAATPPRMLPVPHSDALAAPLSRDPFVFPARPAPLPRRET